MVSMSKYNLQDFQTLVAASNWDCLNEDRIRNTLDSLDWDYQNLEDVLRALIPSDFHKTTFNQVINNFPSQDRVDVDQYRIYWDGSANCRAHNTTKIESFRLFVKIAVMTDSQGRTAGVVSFHLG